MESCKSANINIMGIVSNSSRGDVLKALTEHFIAEETGLAKKTVFDRIQNPYIDKEDIQGYGDGWVASLDAFKNLLDAVLRDLI